ncbi:MAG: hypothetical protein M3Y45_06420, partial [Actinomycetota bacterium]|nr:hypothetical protein [Actinomycetota bacterium]
MFEIKRSPLVLLVVAGMLVGVAGCGGDDGEEPAAPEPVTTTDTATSITKDELIAEGDDICAEVNAAVGTISSSTTADDSIKETQIADIYTGLAERLGDLGTPSDGEAPTDVIEAAQTLADSSSIDGATALSSFQTAATDYGFNDCGDAPAAPSPTTETPSTADPGATAVPPEPAPAPAPAPAEPAPAPPAPAPGGGVVP